MFGNGLGTHSSYTQQPASVCIYRCARQNGAGLLVFRKMLVFYAETDEASPFGPYRFRDNIRPFAKRTATQPARLEMTHTLRSLGNCTTHCRSMVRGQASCEHNGNAK